MRVPPSKPLSPRASLSRSLELSIGKLARCLEDPTEKNIHDVRTSIRRLQAAYLLLPKRIRRERDLSKRMDTFREILKEYNIARDSDVIRAKILALTPRRKVPSMMASLDSDRERGLALARKAGLKLVQTPEVRLEKSPIRGGERRARLEKVAGKLSRRVQRSIRTVSRDANLVDELHTLRIDSKMLRYIQELADAPSPEVPTVGYLKRLQDSLGAIHDCDVTLAYLRKHGRGKENLPLIQQVRSERMKEFRKFARRLSKPPEPSQIRRTRK